MMGSISRMNGTLVTIAAVSSQIWSALLSPILAWINDGELLQPCFERCACKRKTYGPCGSALSADGQGASFGSAVGPELIATSIRPSSLYDCHEMGPRPGPRQIRPGPAQRRGA